MGVGLGEGRNALSKTGKRRLFHRREGDAKKMKRRVFLERRMDHPHDPTLGRQQGYKEKLLRVKSRGGVVSPGYRKGTKRTENK